MSDTHRPKIDGSTEAGLLIAVEPERNTIGIIRSLIVTNNTTMSDQELAAWIYETYRKRTENHIERVKRCATWYKQYFLDHFENGQAVYEKFMRQVEQHDADKFYGPENVAYYATNTVLFNPKWHDFYEISQETMDKFEQDYWPKHYVNNPHHPEYWAVTKTDDKTGEQYCRCDRDSLEAAFRDRETQAIVLAEMVSDWSAMGCELGDSANAWFEKTNGKRFIWEDDIIDWFLRPMLALERTGDTEVNNSLPHGLEKDFATPPLKGISDEVLKAAVITPVVTTVVVSPTEVYTIHRGETIETKNGCRIMVDNDGNPHALEGSSEALEVSTEALPAGFKEKRKKIEAYILSSMKLLDPHTDVNQKYWKNKFASMSDADFDKFMHYMQEKKCNIHMFVPPLKVTLKNSELVEAAHKLGVKLMHRIWMTDPNTGMRYLTPEEYMVVQLPVRRQQQYLDEKISVPDNDKTIDGLTGQVTGDSKACAITNPEIQIMQARNLDASLYEYVNVRGGNINNYAEFKRSLEETGAVSLNSLDPNNRTRVSVMGGVLLTAMMIENNLAEV